MRLQHCSCLLSRWPTDLAASQLSAACWLQNVVHRSLETGMQPEFLLPVSQLQTAPHEPAVSCHAQAAL